MRFFQNSEIDNLIFITVSIKKKKKEKVRENVSQYQFKLLIKQYRGLTASKFFSYKEKSEYKSMSSKTRISYSKGSFFH